MKGRRKEGTIGRVCVRMGCQEIASALGGPLSLVGLEQKSKVGSKSRKGGESHNTEDAASRYGSGGVSSEGATEDSNQAS